MNLDVIGIASYVQAKIDRLCEFADSVRQLTESMRSKEEAFQLQR